MGEPVGDLLDLYRRLLANVLVQRDGCNVTRAHAIAEACERAIRTELEDQA